MVHLSLRSQTTISLLSAEHQLSLNLLKNTIVLLFCLHISSLFCLFTIGNWIVIVYFFQVRDLWLNQPPHSKMAVLDSTGINKNVNKQLSTSVNNNKTTWRRNRKWISWPEITANHNGTAGQKTAGVAVPLQCLAVVDRRGKYFFMANPVLVWYSF